jgi:hypothetical protein
MHGFQFLNKAVKSLLGNIYQHNSGAGLDQPAADRPSDGSRSTRDQGYLTSQAPILRCHNPAYLLKDPTRFDSR